MGRGAADRLPDTARLGGFTMIGPCRREPGAVFLRPISEWMLGRGVFTPRRAGSGRTGAVRESIAGPCDHYPIARAAAGSCSFYRLLAVNLVPVGSDDARWHVG